jgi:hypothetical protein
MVSTDGSRSAQVLNTELVSDVLVMAGPAVGVVAQRGGRIGVVETGVRGTEGDDDADAPKLGWVRRC